jgi:hypothetical protein
MHKILDWCLIHFINYNQDNLNLKLVILIGVGLICIKNWFKIMLIWIQLWLQSWILIRSYPKHISIKLRDRFNKIMIRDTHLSINLHRYSQKIKKKLHSLLELSILWCHSSKLLICIRFLILPWEYLIIP